ncbi:MAG TPA: bifunctional oligoribonuclease/PAP phosphatase NrnA [Patescibacteria group bacterium]|jgi:phosphoesterase RecJ-like protein|nr:bifunctional oligoribonuclease/PAP phosphatase NrnA [Patescibacteria group bacterium]
MIKPEFKTAWELINSAQHILLTTHEGTDGDDLGSLLAVKAALEKMNKKVFAAVKGGVPRSLIFLPGSETVGETLDTADSDLLITFGCNKIQRTGMEQLYSLSFPIINFDHHPDNTNFGRINVVDPATSAVAELVYYFLVSNQTPITQQIATCLLTGIFTDTGGFKHANTTAEALEVAATLLKKGARIDKIAIQTMGRKRPATIKAWAKGLENARFDSKKKMVFSVLTEDDLKEIGATDEDLDGFVELLNNIPQARFALLLRQDGDLVRGSLRSETNKKVDVAKIAKSFGGGGHKLAAGFKVAGKLIKDGDAWRIK